MDDSTRRIVLPLPADPAAAGAVTAFGLSECGPVRSTNEDAFTFDVDLGLFVVSDGMGGHAAGEVASHLAVETITAFIARSRDEQDPEILDDVDPALSAEANRLRTALLLANARLLRTAATDAAYQGMGATVVAVLLSGANMIIAHAGDSRVYEHYEGQLTQLTRDDSLAEMLAEMNADAAARERLAARRNVVTNVLGGDDHIVVHVSERPRVRGRVLLLCSDGVHGVLDDGRIGGILASHDGPRRHAERLVTEAIAAGGRDNVTALVVADGEAM